MKNRTIEIPAYEPKYYCYNRTTKERYGPFESINEILTEYGTQYSPYVVQSFSFHGFAEHKGIRREEYTNDCKLIRTRIAPYIHYCVVNEFDCVISLRELRKAYRMTWKPRNGGHEAWERENEQTNLRLTKKKGGSHKIKSAWASTDHGDGFYWNYGGIHRQMQTTAEKRANLGHVDEYRDEFPNIVRHARRGKNLPSAWDDHSNGIWKRRKCWKDHSKRRKQWKPK